MIDAILALVAAGQNPVVMTREPRPAEQWEQTVRFGCRGDELQISGYGPQRPAGRSVAIVMNGRPVSGAEVDTLARDLGNDRAVYRITGLCSQTESGIRVIFWAGEMKQSGDFEFRSAAASFQDGRLRHYTGLQPSDAEGFWFR